MLRGNYDHNTYQRNYLEDEQRLFTKADEEFKKSNNQKEFKGVKIFRG
jgi:hypothetical protein